MPSNEGFYIDEHGKKADAAIHDDLLGDDDRPPADFAKLAKELGLSDEFIRESLQLRPPREV